MAIETFYRIVLRDGDVPHGAVKQTYFNYVEHGGLTDEPLFAALVWPVNLASLVHVTSYAKKEFPNVKWEPMRVLLDVVPFENRTSLYDEAHRADYKRAYDRLSEPDRQALGLKEPE